ncbi:carboxypeptidase regulatory-like domain-containing protein [Colwelliaceae bacterium MEBiC 14330]
MNTSRSLYHCFSFLLFVIFISNGFIQSVQAAEPIDGWVVNNNLEVSFSNPVRSRRSPDATLDATIVNTGNEPIIGPLRLVINVFTPNTVTLTGSDGIIAGYQYFTVIAEGEELAAGAQVTTSKMTVAGGGRTVFSINGNIYSQPIVKPSLLVVDILTPKTLLTVGTSPIEVTGTINNENAQLTLNGVPVVYQGNSFTASVELNEGFNTIAARATTTDGQQVTDSVVVSLDLTPPYLTIESHTEKQIVYTDKITVTGLVNDIVRGTVEAKQASVQVNGIAAEVSNRSYAAQNVVLTEGTNIIEVTGVDSSGNSDTIEQTVIYKAISGSKLKLISGQDQTGDIGNTLAQPLAVQLVDGLGNGIANETVVFRVTQGAGVVAAETDTPSRAVIVTTDTDGKANTHFQVGFRTGVANHKVKAKVVGYENEVIFTASASSVIGDKISINSGNNQRGIVGQSLPAPFIVAVSDDGANTVQGARVRFNVVEGEGVFQNEQSSFETITDSDGRATAQLTLGDLTGIDAQRVEAVLIDGPEDSTLMAGFSATAFIAADPGNTSVSGVVLDNQDKPIPGVTVRIENTDRTATTDQQGQFMITQAPVGPVHILIDGSTATVAGEYPTLSYHLVTVSGVENPMSAPVYMVKLDTENGVFAGKEDAVLTLENFPGFKLEIAKDSVTFPDGSREGIISVTSVNASKIPMAPPNGMQPQFIVTIQPVGATFSPAAKLTLPNVDGHAPGAQVEMYSFDHDLEEFVAIGLGTVSEDGSVVSSNPGVGVVKAGWHCGSQPGGSGTAHNCPECQHCPSTSCVRDPSQDNNPRKQQTPEDCKTALCKGFRAEPGDLPFGLDKPNNCKKPGCDGKSPVLVADDSDKPVEDTEKGNCKAPSCLNGKEMQNSLIDDEDIPTEDTEIGNCFKPSCFQGVPRQNMEPDPTDISKEDEKCKFCDGNLGLTNSPNTRTCDDGEYCTSFTGTEPGPDKCEDGKCEGKKIKYNETTLGQEYNLTTLKSILNGANIAQKFVPGCSSGGAPSVTGAINLKIGKECCESKKSTVDTTALEGSVELTLPALSCKLPVWSVGVATLTANLGVAGSGQVTGAGIKSDCDESCGWDISGSTNLKMSGAVGLHVLHPDVLGVEGGVKGTGSIKVQGQCEGVTVSGCVGPPAAFGTVTFGGLITKEISHTFSSVVACF